MEIHRPKPFHGWRELAKEVGVIVIGIAIALSGEQLIERLHRHSEVVEARKALRSEIAANASAARFNVEYERCLSADLALFDAWAKGSPHPPRVEPLPWMRPGAAAWDVVKAGAAAHMPLDERLAYSQLYNDAANMGSIVEMEGSAWLRLAADFTRATLGPTDERRVLEDTNQARILGSIQSRYSLAVLQDAKAMGAEPSPISAGTRGALAKFCSALGIAPTID